MSLIQKSIEHLRAGESLRVEIERTSEREATLVIRPRRANADNDVPDSESAEARLLLAVDQPIKLGLTLDGDTALDAEIDEALSTTLKGRAQTRSALDRYRESQSEAQKHAKASTQSSADSAASTTPAGDGATGTDQGKEQAAAPAPDSDPNSLL